MTTAPDGTQSIIRALSVLKMFDDSHPSWDLQDLTEASNLNKTTLFRILGALEYEGLLEKNEDGRYILGSEMIALGGRAARVNNLRTVSHPILKQLTALTGETTTLEVMRHENDQTWSMLVIDEVIGKHLVGITQYIGSRLPIHATSTGKAVLAFSDAETQQTILKAQFASFTDDTRINADDLSQDLSSIEAQGFSLAYGELELGLVAIGAPVFDANNQVRAAISLTGASVRIKRDNVSNLAMHVCEHAQKISYQLGYRG
ncbi:MAG: IclR family transcriptional regulator [Phototrophicaceae bacterium]